MRFGVKAKETVALTVLTFLVVATTTVVHLSQLSRVVVEGTREQAQLVARQIYAQSRRALAGSRGAPPLRVLQRARNLRSLLEASIGYSPNLVYVLIADQEGQVILDSEQKEEGTVAPAREQLGDLLALDPLRRFLTLYRGGGIYETTLPIQLNGKPFGSIRLGVSTTLLRPELKASLRQSLALAGIALPVAWLVAMGLSGVILKPVRRLALEMDRLRRGEFDAKGLAAGGDEIGELAAQIQDLGQQMHADRLAMLSERDQLQQVVDHLEDGIVFLNENGEILFYNRAAEEVVGAPLGQTLGSQLSSVLEAGHPLRPLLERSFEQRDGFRNGTVVVPAEGRSRELLVSHFFVSDARRTMGSVVLLRDLSSIKTLQSLISYSAKLAALGRLTSGVAHEVKNPLNAMMIHLELLREKLANSPEEVQGSLEVIRGEIHRLDRAVQGFLKFMRPQELTLQPVDLNGMLREVASLLETEWQEAGIHFRLDLEPALPAVTADEGLLRQMFMNIVLNACQSMPTGGNVRITTARETKGPDFVTVSIADKGVGIPSEDQDKIFKLYYTTKPEGSGIGLSLAYRIVQMHDGAIEVASEAGCGTTMLVRLPANGGRS